MWCPPVEKISSYFLSGHQAREKRKHPNRNIKIKALVERRAKISKLFYSLQPQQEGFPSLPVLFQDRVLSKICLEEHISNKILIQKQKKKGFGWRSTFKKYVTLQWSASQQLFGTDEKKALFFFYELCTKCQNYFDSPVNVKAKKNIFVESSCSLPHLNICVEISHMLNKIKPSLGLISPQQSVMLYVSF